MSPFVLFLLFSLGLKCMVGIGQTSCIGLASTRELVFLSQPAPSRNSPFTQTPSYRCSEELENRCLCIRRARHHYLATATTTLMADLRTDRAQPLNSNLASTCPQVSGSEKPVNVGSKHSPQPLRETLLRQLQEANLKFLTFGGSVMLLSSKVDT